MQYGLSITEIIISFIITGIVYVGLPALFTFAVKKDRPDKKAAKIICIVTGVIGYFAFSFYRAYSGIEGGGSLYPAVIWSIVAYNLIKKKEQPAKPMGTDKAVQAAKIGDIVPTSPEKASKRTIDPEAKLDTVNIEIAARNCYSSVIAALKKTGMTINEEVETAAIMSSLADLTAHSGNADRYAVVNAVTKAIKDLAHLSEADFKTIDKRMDLYGKVIRKEVAPKGIWWPGGEDSFKPILESPLGAVQIVYGDLLISEELQNDYEDGPFPIIDIFSLAEYGPTMTRVVFKEMRDFCLGIQSAFKAEKVFTGLEKAVKNNTENKRDTVNTKLSKTQAISDDSGTDDTDIPVEALKKLKDLYDAGIFSEEEFKEKKKQLLNL